jgi:hypothetical protein
MFILIELLNEFTGENDGGGFDELSNAMVECGIVFKTPKVETCLASGK